MARSRAAQSSEREAARHEAAETGPDLLAAGGPFEQFPGGVMLSGPSGRVLGANEAAQPLADLLLNGGMPEFQQAIAAALDGNAAQINPLLLDGPEDPDEVGQAYDVVVLPWVTGSTALVLARDITLERCLRAALIESRQRYKDLVEASSDFAWETDAEGHFTFVSPRGAAGYAAGQLIDQHAADILLETDDAEGLPFTTRVPVEGVEIRARTAGGESACFSAIGLPLVGPSGEWRGARGICREVTRERAREAELARARHREALLGYILRIVRDELDPASMLKAAAGALGPALSARGVAIYRRDRKGRLAHVARSGRLPCAEEIKPLLARIAAGEGEVTGAGGDGHVLVRATRFERDWNGALCLWRDAEAHRNDDENKLLLDEIAAQIAVANARLSRERELEKRATTDGLTGLLNRRGFLERMERRFSRAAERDRPGALFHVDLDDLKAVNDARGHDAGDRVLVDLASLLKGQIRRGDLAARLGGDAFALFLAGIEGDAARQKAQSLLDGAAALRLHSVSKKRPLGLSIGVAIYEPSTPDTVDELIARADRAMDAAKRAGKGRVEMAGPAGSETGS